MADEFDPDAFLKGQGEFDPDAFLKEETAQPPRLSGHERQRNYLEALRAGLPELAAGHSELTPGPDLSGERRTAGQNIADWGEVGKGAAKAVPATIAGGLVGDVEGLGRAGINLVGSNPVVPFSVDPHTAIPTTEEGGYLGPRGLGIMEASTTALERAGSFLGSMAGPGVALRGARAAGEAATALRAIPETVRIHPEAPVGAVRTESGARLLPTETPHILPAEVRAAPQGPTHAGVGAEGAFGPLMDVRPEAINHLRQVLREDGWTPHTLETRLEEMSPHQSLFELSPNLEDRAQKLAVAPGASRNEMANFLRVRQAETQDRLRSTFNRAFGEPIDVAQELRTISIDQRRAASPLYREFETLRVHPTAEIQALMPRLRGLEGTARRLAQLEGVPFDQTFFVGGPNKVWPTARSWDQIKQAIDAKIEGSFNQFGEATKWTRAYTQLKNDLINAIEAPSQGRVGEVYREARRAFAEPAAIKSATRMGERLLNASIRADELPFLTAAYSEAEMNALRQGLRAHLEDRLGRPGRVERKMINDILAPNNERKIRWVVGDEAADELLRGIRYEHEMWDSPQRIIGGSQTGARVGENPYLNKPGLLDETTAGDLIETLAHPVKTGLKHGVEMFTKRKMFEKSRRAREAKLNQYREDLSRLFTAQGPERDAIVRWLFDTMDEAPRARGGRVERNRGGLARLANNKAMKAKRLHGTPFKQWIDAVGRAEGGPVKLSFTPEGYPYYDNPPEGPEPPGSGGFSEAVEVPEDTKPIGLAAQQDPVGLSERRPEPAPEDPFERAAIRQRRGVAGGRQPTEAVNVGLGSEIEEKPDWMLEPMLEQQQKGEFVPEGMKPEETAIDEFGRLINKQTFEPIKMIERPGMLPLVGTPRGVEFAMPKILDVAGYLGGGWGAAGKGTMLSSGLPLERKVLERGRSGRPIRTEPFSTAGDQAILEAGAETALRANPAPQFFSALERAVNNAKLNKATPDQWLGYLRNQPGVKAEELEWVRPLEGAQGHLTKQQLQTAIAERKVRLEETTLGEKPGYKRDELYIDDDFQGGQYVVRRSSDAEIVAGPFERRNHAGEARAALLAPNETRYGEYQLPGGTNYRELLLRMPEAELKLPEGWEIVQDKNMFYVFDKKRKLVAGAETRKEALQNAMYNFRNLTQRFESPNFTSSHWDEPNVLAHVRMNDRDIPGVGRSLHLEEIQSDWGQKGRKEGFALSEAEKKRLASEEDRIIEKMSHDPETGEFKAKRSLELGEITKEEAETFEKALRRNANKVPNMPFKSTWADLSLKRMIREAAEKNYDAISWTPGEAQAARYDLSKQIDQLKYNEKSGTLTAYKNGSTIIDKSGIKPEQLSDYIGKEAAEKLMKQKEEPPVRWKLDRWYKGGQEYPEKEFTNLKEAEAASNERGQPLVYVQNYASGLTRQLSGLDLKVGGEGMKAFYDKMLVDKANALGKKYGARVDVKYLPEVKKSDPIASIMEGYGVAKEQAAEILNDLGPAIRSGNKNKLLDEIESADIVPDYPELLANRLLGISSQPVMVMKLTPAMKRAALREGFPLFSGAPLPTGAVQDRQERKAGGRVEPTEAQKEAGNYKKGHVAIHGLNIAIENRAGSQRSGTDKGGKRWSVRMPAHYGYIKGTVGRDKDHVDCYIGPNPGSNKVLIVNQLDAATGKFDEHKCMLGFATRKQAENTYLRGFSDGTAHKRLGHVTEADITEFKDWLNNGNTKKPVKRSD